MDIASSVGKIQVLPSDVIGRIAAGEVVERPAAVVKELLENSLDAGSVAITVEIKDGGLGVNSRQRRRRRDVVSRCLAFERHATSKLRSDEQLGAVRTMGFRGEALPSIAGRLEVRSTTVARHDEVGTQLWLTGGTITRVEDVAAIPGTTIDVSELFFNTPARRKFLKSTTTEFSHISHVVQQAALAWPRWAHMRLVHNGYEVFALPAVSSPRDRVLQVYRAAFGERALAVDVERDGLSLKGFIVDPVCARSGRTPQELFVNRRPIKNSTVQHAVIDGYSSSGQGPCAAVCVVSGCRAAPGGCECPSDERGSVCGYRADSSVGSFRRAPDTRSGTGGALMAGVVPC